MNNWRAIVFKIEALANLLTPRKNKIQGKIGGGENSGEAI